MQQEQLSYFKKKYFAINYSFKKVSSTEKRYQKKILFFYQKVLQFCFDVIFFIIFFVSFAVNFQKTLHYTVSKKVNVAVFGTKMRHILRGSSTEIYEAWTLFNDKWISFFYDQTFFYCFLYSIHTWQFILKCLFDGLSTYSDFFPTIIHSTIVV